MSPCKTNYQFFQFLKCQTILLGLYSFRKIQYANHFIGKILLSHFFSTTFKLDILSAIIANITYDNHLNASKWLRLGMKKFS